MALLHLARVSHSPLSWWLKQSIAAIAEWSGAAVEVLKAETPKP